VSVQLNEHSNQWKTIENLEINYVKTILMTKKILELTEKIYNEGVEKAKKDAELIITQAKKKANTIIKSAESNANNTIKHAEMQAAEIKKNTDSEIQLAARQFISSLKQQISQLIITRQVEMPVKNAFKDDDFVKNIILTMIRSWNPQESTQLDIRLLLPKKDEKELTDFFNNKARKLLDAGLDINFEPKLTNGFRIGPKEGNYYIGFTDKDFENYFKNYLKEKTRKIIFD